LFDEAAAEARGNPAAAQRLFDMLLCRRKDAAAIQDTLTHSKASGYHFMSHPEG
jgi:hypothetical protein